MTRKTTTSSFLNKTKPSLATRDTNTTEVELGGDDTAPTAKVTMNKMLLLMWRLGYLNGQDKSQSVPTDDPERLVELSFDCYELALNYPIEWKSSKKERLYREIIAPKHNEEYIGFPKLQVVRLRALNMPVLLENPLIHFSEKVAASSSYSSLLKQQLHRFQHQGQMEFNLTPFYYGYEMDEKTADGMDWYVNFADQNLFAYCETDFFASDEILALEHPILGSVREALSDITKYGLFSKTFWEWFSGEQGSIWKDSVCFDDPNMYIPKDKSKMGLRYKEFSPKSIDQAGRPTPARGAFENTSKKKTDVDKTHIDYDIYGEKFRDTQYSIVRRAVTCLKGQTNAQHCLTNLITMTAIDQLANPLRPKTGRYKIYEIRHIFRTAYTAFRGAVRKSWSLGFPLVSVHTGDWGCGEFGGNRTVMSFLQMAAAKAAGVTRLYYHTLGPKDDILEAQELLARTWTQETVKTEDILRAIEGKNKEWKAMNSRG
ncbi:hypothetical protein HDU97_000689 [Phlyctochytrium planicorne]|nr:hypothetical protein HDU97_000689 [Phlyctochytrium planicorne]